MGLEDLLRTMERDAEAELAEVVAADEQRARRVVEDAREAAAAERRARIDEARAQVEEEARLVLAAARARAVARARADREGELAAVRADAEQTLRELVGTPAGVRATERLLAEALDAVPRATRCRVSPDRLAEVSRAHPRLEVTGDLETIGAIVADDRGRVLDNTAPTRLANAWPSLAPALARRWVQA
ncbi:MAG: hypothetical protein ACRCSN_10880 [Dermatophilaceae bacterium]